MDDAVKCINAGTLRYRPPNRYWVDYKYKRVRLPCRRMDDQYYAHDNSMYPVKMTALLALWRIERVKRMRWILVERKWLRM